MAFSTTVHERHLDEMRFRSIDGQQFPATYAPLRPTASEINNHNQPVTADIRAGLTRRFTTDAMNPPQISSVWDQSRLSRIPVADTLDLAPMDADVCAYLQAIGFSKLILSRNVRGSTWYAVG